MNWIINVLDITEGISRTFCVSSEIFNWLKIMEKEMELHKSTTASKVHLEGHWIQGKRREANFINKCHVKHIKKRGHTVKTLSMFQMQPISNWSVHFLQISLLSKMSKQNWHMRLHQSKDTDGNHLKIRMTVNSNNLTGKCWGPNIMFNGSALLLCILEILGSNLSSKPGYPEVFTVLFSPSK
jgi:hypothetical protein